MQVSGLMHRGSDPRCGRHHNLFILHTIALAACSVFTPRAAAYSSRSMADVMETTSGLWSSAYSRPNKLFLRIADHNEISFEFITLSCDGNLFDVRNFKGQESSRFVQCTCPTHVC